MSKIQRDYDLVEAANAIAVDCITLRMWLAPGSDKGPDPAGFRFSVWDVAHLRVARELIKRGTSVEPAFALQRARFAVDRTFGEDAASGKAALIAEERPPVYLVVTKDGLETGGIRLITVQPGDLEALREVDDAVYQGATVLMIENLVMDAWYSLPNLPAEVSLFLEQRRTKL